jgi:DNA-binding MurR/RpiR family transcriptional regulator
LTVRDRITEKLPHLSPVERRIAEFTLSNYRECAFMSLEQLAGATEVSNTSINRYARSLGFAGYLQYRKSMGDEMMRSMDLIRSLQEQLTNEAPEAVLRKSLAQDRALLDELISGLDAAAFTSAVEQIEQARTVWVIGQGSSAYLGGYLVFLARGLGVRLNDLADVGGIESIARAAMDIAEGDVLITISFPRYTSSTSEIAAFARRRGCKIISVTNSLTSELARSSDLILFTPASPGPLSGSGTTAIAVIEALVAALTSRSSVAEESTIAISSIIDPYLMP